MLGPGVTRNRLADVLSAAFAGGLLSEDTLSHRLGILFGSRLIDPRKLVGDLSHRTRRRRRFASRTTFAAWRRMILRASDADAMPLVLALNWSSGEADLLLGRSDECDIRFSNDSVSRRHARLVFRDGAWIIQDLGSTNGTQVNGTSVGRCEIHPGDRVDLGEQLLQVD
jgi:hypothetical protein